MSILEHITTWGKYKHYPIRIINREQGRQKPREELTTPNFYRGQITPKFRRYIYYLLLILGIICMAIVLGGMLGILLQSL